MDPLYANAKEVHTFTLLPLLANLITARYFFSFFKRQTETTQQFRQWFAGAADVLPQSRCWLRLKCSSGIAWGVFRGRWCV